MALRKISVSHNLISGEKNKLMTQILVLISFIIENAIGNEGSNEIGKALLSNATLKKLDLYEKQGSHI